MVTTSKINLMDEICEEQRNNDIIVLTTFKFDAPFVDIHLINKIFDNNPSADIFILIDAREYDQSYKFFTKHTGRLYNLIPVYCNKGVFHPKLFLFYSKEDSRITSYIGSSNITLAGFTSNAEIVTKVSSILDPVDSVAQEATEYFSNLIEKEFVINNKFSEAIKKISDSLINQKPNDEISLIHNLEKPILEQTLEQISLPEEVTMLAPFWSPNSKVIDKINKKNTLKKLNIMIQKNNHNFSNQKAYQDYCNQNKINLKFYNATFEKNRIFHSKILQMRSENPVSLLGSSNMTESALLKDASNGNFEVAALIKEDISEIIKDINKEEIVNIEPNTIDFSLLKSENQIKILSVDFDIITRDLSLLFLKDGLDKEIEIIYEDETKESYKVKNQTKFSIQCKKIPFEIIIKQGNETTRRRIFYDTNYFYKKIAKGSITLTDINKKIAKDYNLSAIELLRILSGINVALEKNKGEITERKKHEKTKDTFGSPPRDAGLLPNREIINNFSKIYRLFISKKEDEEDEEEFGEIEKSNSPKMPFKIRKFFDSDKEAEKIGLKTLDSINNILKYKASLNENPNIEIVEGMPLMIQFIIKVLGPTYINNKILENFKQYINENLKNMNKEEINFETRKILFNNLVLINYYFKKKISYSFLPKLFDMGSVLRSEFIQECFNQVKCNLSELNYENYEEKEIMKYAGHLASFIPTKTVEKDFIKSLETINYMSNELELEFTKEYLKNLVQMWGFSSSRKEFKELIYETIKKYPKEKEYFINEIFQGKLR
jgi:hypothetical protein